MQPDSWYNSPVVATIAGAVASVFLGLVTGLLIFFGTSIVHRLDDIDARLRTVEQDVAVIKGRLKINNTISAGKEKSCGRIQSHI